MATTAPIHLDVLTQVLPPRRTTYRVVALINATFDWAPTAHHDSVYLVGDACGSLHLEVRAGRGVDALNVAYAVGNRATADSMGHTWPAQVRTLSVGDFLAVLPIGVSGAIHEVETYVVDPVDFTPVTVDWDRVEWVQGPEAVTSTANRLRDLHYRR